MRWGLVCIVLRIRPNSNIFPQMASIRAADHSHSRPQPPTQPYNLLIACACNHNATSTAPKHVQSPTLATPVTKCHASQSHNFLPLPQKIHFDISGPRNTAHTPVAANIPTSICRCLMVIATADQQPPDLLSHNRTPQQPTTTDHATTTLKDNATADCHQTL